MNKYLLFPLLILLPAITEAQDPVVCSNPQNYVVGSTAAITDTTRTEVIAAPGANFRIYITGYLVQNSDASVSTWVQIEDGTTDKFYVYAPAAGGGASGVIPISPVRQTSKNTAWNAVAETTSAEVRVTLFGCKYNN